MECQNCNNIKFYYNFKKSDFLYCFNCCQNTLNKIETKPKKKKRKKYKKKIKNIIPEFDLNDPNLFFLSLTF
tara:strand:- start:417 stop:632 length:216 start_codon:yes stop_codon:yes gene_type:complete